MIGSKNFGCDQLSCFVLAQRSKDIGLHAAHRLGKKNTLPLINTNVLVL